MENMCYLQHPSTIGHLWFSCVKQWQIPIIASTEFGHGLVNLPCPKGNPLECQNAFCIALMNHWFPFMRPAVKPLYFCPVSKWLLTMFSQSPSWGSGWPFTTYERENIGWRNVSPFQDLDDDLMSGDASPIGPVAFLGFTVKQKSGFVCEVEMAPYLYPLKATSAIESKKLLHIFVGACFVQSSKRLIWPQRLPFCARKNGGYAVYEDIMRCVSQKKVPRLPP